MKEKIIYSFSELDELIGGLKDNQMILLNFEPEFEGEEDEE